MPLYGYHSVPSSDEEYSELSLYMCSPLSSVAVELLGPKASSELLEPPPSLEDTGSAAGVAGVASWSSARREMTPAASCVGALHMDGPTQVVPPTWYQTVTAVATGAWPDSGGGAVRVTTADPCAVTGTCSATWEEPQLALSCEACVY